MEGFSTLLQDVSGGIEGVELFTQTTKKKRSSKKPEDQQIKKERFLSIGNLAGHELDHLIESNERYARWLRVLLLRFLVHTNALGMLKGNFSYIGARVFSFLGFENMEAFASTRDVAVLRQDLLLILSSWELEFGRNSVLPQHLSNNLVQLQALGNLDEIQTRILGLSILIHAETIVQDVTELVGESVSAFSVSRIFAPLLNVNPAVVEEALDDQSQLIKSGLLSLDHRGEGSLRSRLDLITWSFAKRVVMPHSDVREVIRGFVVPAKPSSLELNDFEHIAERVQTVKEYLGAAIKHKTKGVNILIYGAPGTGKTEFAKLISREIGLELLEISAMDLRGQPISPMLRIRGYRLAQSLFSGGKAAILFDECEEVLSIDGASFAGADTVVPQKSWINFALENNSQPTIWITNSIKTFDAAYIRRFDICFEMPLPNELKRRELMANLCGSQIDQNLILEIAKNQYTSLALISKTSQVVQALSDGKTKAQLNHLAVTLVNDKLQAQGVPQIEPTTSGVLQLGFCPKLINSSLDLEHLCEGLIHTQEGRICLYGPPGTGKTAFGGWLANRLSIPHIVLKASELLGSHVGDTERSIAMAFDRAKQEKALLQFDEVDTFLSSRNTARQSWEISMVNEMLTQMEAFKGVFIASTNLFHNLDEAALRRFDVSLKFDFLSKESAWLMLKAACDQMNLDFDEHDLRPQVDRLNSLTPGDFEQVARLSRFVKFRSATEVLNSLEKTIGAKQNKQMQHIGFI